MTSDSADRNASTWGNIALTTSETGNEYQISHRTSFNPKGWNANLSDMWDDFADSIDMYAYAPNLPFCRYLVTYARFLVYSLFRTRQTDQPELSPGSTAGDEGH